MTRPRLVGVGVGPGDPDLLTIAGLRECREASRIFVPVLGTDEQGRAEAVVRAHLPAGHIERLVFALNDTVTGPQERRRRHWDAAAERVAEHLRCAGGSAVFATIGDPAVYSTFGYLASTVRSLVGDLDVATVPGITAMQAAASTAGLSLTEGTEPLTVIPVTRDLAALRAALEGPGTVVAYKGGRRIAELRAAVAEAGALDRAIHAEHLGTKDERVRALAELADEPAPYLSTVVVLPPRGGRGEQL
ncbi:precorrin-2 C20-methyltransferase /cobalt-factor II C20-methyltransferase [Tamaricihabitans halophyticus]|uniref:Precorrin-2 C20-methyltransferase /cobalt-factor II C20-methyltransferase n=1 Tax=Tamaricihabitans halophyticus TaxID=1262583 RepID=A0A4R2QUL9_9PSEU|nr:precorrin-2 C(20)-methyltransferase [Tamaricihabitans halophyticus]TCP50791.1 precorrin-2 C20-methyltransferase /cobalt-factor II C20-methyltransferase [Tamaricihabitans halophyticus]